MNKIDCLPYGDPRLLVEVWVDEHREAFYREGCRGLVCVEHRARAKREGRCSEFCGVCFDGILGSFGMAPKIQKDWIPNGCAYFGPKDWVPRTSLDSQNG